MSRSLVLGNGNMLICMDEHAQARDLYFPYVGLENHIGGQYKHRVGVWVEGKMRWLDDGWDIKIQAEENAPISDVFARNNEIEVELHFSDTVYNEKNIFIREVTVKNLTNRRREIKLYFAHEFEIYESRRGDTAYFDPIRHTVIHYSKKRVFLVNGQVDKKSFDDYTTGIFNIDGKEGSYKTAEQGELPKNPIEHGPIDSVVGFYMILDSHETKTTHYWMTIAKSIQEAEELDNYVLTKTPAYLINTTRDFWSAWVNRYNHNFHLLNSETVALFKKSLFVIRVHSDNHGAILSSGDSDMLQFGKDSYGYSWPRDGAASALALDLTGNTNIARRYFQFCDTTLANDGYLLHKYCPDGSLGSSWHSWVQNGEITFPIQEDATALVVYALWNHYEISKDIEFIESIYNSFIKKASEFLLIYRDRTTKLPKPSYDLWEEKYGISTHTTALVIAGLVAASNFARVLGKERSEKRYREAADEIREKLSKYLFDEEAGYFYKMLNVKNNEIIYDKTLDIGGFYGLFAFSVFDINDERLTRFANVIKERLQCKTSIGGFGRYEGDVYFRQKEDQNVPGNPWIITTLWMAQYYIAKAKTEIDLKEAQKLIDWTVDRAMESGVLAEQFDPYNGKPLSAVPLTWSHAEFVITIVRYLDKLEDLGLCQDCNPVSR